jgi:tetratricopeptide (TPR) repeat protein
LLRVPGEAFHAWLDRNVGFVPGSILKWERSSNAGHASARTSGPWRVVAKRIEIKPRPDAAASLIERHVRDTSLRSADPDVLFRAAQAARDNDEWEAALELGDKAMRVYATKRLPRLDPRWHRLRLFVAQTEMQIGEEGLLPTAAVNVLRSIGNPGPQDHALMLVRGSACYVAALTSAQGSVRRPIDTALSYLDRGIEILERARTAVAVQERWRLAAFREEVLTNHRKIAEPQHSSAIIRASEEIEGSKDEKRASYGEMLVAAGQPARGLEYLIPALERVPRIRSNAWVAAERARIVGEWLSGARRSTTLSALEAHASAIGRLGFEHQLRVTQARIARVRNGIRSTS